VPPAPVFGRETGDGKKFPPRRPPWRWFSLLVLASLAAVGCARTRAATAPVPPAPSSPPASPSIGPANIPSSPATLAPTPSAPLPSVPAPYVEVGIASWYGAPFNGRIASSGEVFDMNQAVAAHRTLPFGSIVCVTNMTNGQHTDVRIIDRGPFVGGRVIDLSRSAAHDIGMLGPGTARVRLELLSAPAPLAGDFTVQVGAFEHRQDAERLRSRLAARYTVFIQEFDSPAGHFFLVRVGREPTLQAAQRLAAQLSAQRGVRTFVVRFDETR
jgi:rare lipoprotein A